MVRENKTSSELKLTIESLKRQLDDHIVLKDRLEFENNILRKSEEKFSKVFQSSPDWIVISTLEQGRFINVNKAFLNITGFTESEVIGKTAIELDIWVNPAEREHMVKTLNETGELRNHEVNFRMKSGEIRTMLRSAEAIDLDNQKCIISVTHDITERKRAETKLEIFAEELKKQNQELEQFAYIVSHDLQSPLITVEGYLRLLKKRYSTELDQKANEMLATTIKTTGRMQQLIKSLLGYTCIEADKNNKSIVDTQTLLYQTLDNLQGIIDKTGAQITHSELPKISVDPVQFSQVLQNLLGNAMKFSTGYPVISICANKKETEWVFSVNDQGVGIPADHQDLIFDVFQHSSPNTNGGTGIGLAVCKKIIENHGGKIWVESVPGNGATFFFSIPQCTYSQEG